MEIYRQNAIFRFLSVSTKRTIRGDDCLVKLRLLYCKGFCPKVQRLLLCHIRKDLQSELQLTPFQTEYRLKEENKSINKLRIRVSKANRMLVRFRSLSPSGFAYSRNIAPSFSSLSEAKQLASSYLYKENPPPKKCGMLLYVWVGRDSNPRSPKATDFI